MRVLQATKIYNISESKCSEESDMNANSIYVCVYIYIYIYIYIYRHIHTYIKIVMLTFLTNCNVRASPPHEVCEWKDTCWPCTDGWTARNYAHIRHLLFHIMHAECLINKHQVSSSGDACGLCSPVNWFESQLSYVR
jgi:hypothetical protein